MNSFQHFMLLFDNLFFVLCTEMRHVFGGNMLVLSLNVTDTENLGSDRKVNSYYNYYM